MIRIEFEKMWKQKTSPEPKTLTKQFSISLSNEFYSFHPYEKCCPKKAIACPQNVQKNKRKRKGSGHCT